MVQLEDLIDDLGGFGKYQVLLTFGVMVHLVPVGWSMLLMSFSGQVPDFYCAQMTSKIISFNEKNGSLNTCSINGSKCSSFVYDIPAPNVITQWNLVCDKEWIKRAIISAQMGGVFVGAVATGYLSGTFGRKKVLYLSQVQHAIVNFVAAMSINWPMFAVCRFLIGLPLGSILVVVFSYPVEFYPIKWRPLSSVLPPFNVGVLLFSLTAFFMPNWCLLHVVCGILSIFPLLGFVFVPESIRWLTIQNRLDDTERIIETLASWNGRQVPEYTHSLLQQIASQEQLSREDRGQYTYMDIFQSWYQTKISLALFFFWFCMSTGYYGISFGISSLSGNIHLNIFLMTMLETPVSLATMFISNAFGRRRSSLAFFGLCTLSMVWCIVIEGFVPGHIKGTLVNVVSMLARLNITSAWAVIANWGPELYPTVTRYLGVGFANMGARIGGVVSPFIINFDSMKFESYGSLLALFGICWVICFFIPETKGIVLRDSLELSRKSPSGTGKSVNATEGETLRSLNEFVSGDNGDFNDN